MTTGIVKMKTIVFYWKHLAHYDIVVEYNMFFSSNLSKNVWILIVQEHIRNIVRTLIRLTELCLKQQPCPLAFVGAMLPWLGLFCRSEACISSVKEQGSDDTAALSHLIGCSPGAGLLKRNGNQRC